jgi:uncharacterized protein YaaW (UPF0174 family)
MRVQRSLAESVSQPLPLSVQRDPLALLFKGGSALAVSSILQPVLLQKIAQQFALHFATYQVAKETLIQTGAVAATQFQNYVALQTARRYGDECRSLWGRSGAFACLGPVLWTWFLLIWVGGRSPLTTVASSHHFAVAQIRLTRADCWEPI